MEDFQKKKKQFEKKDRELFQEVRKLQEAKADDDGDFNKVYELSKKYIQKIIRDIVKDEYATEDIMQETYLQIYNKIDTLKEPEAFYVWAGRIATNLTLRYIQKNRRELLVEADEDGNTDFAFETVGEDTENFIPEAVLMDLEKQRIIAEILDRLSVEQKLCVQYFYYEEMSVKEIAQAFGCSEGTIKSRLNYARKSIKDAVIEMDVKHGTRLYSLAALPLFLIVFRNVLEGAVVLGVGGGAAAGAIGKGVQAVSDGLSEATGGNPVVQTPPVQEPVTPSVQEPVVQAPPAQPPVTPPTQPPVTPPKAGGIVSKIMGTTAGKAAAGIVAAAVVAGSGYAAYQANQAEPEADRTNMIAIYYEIPATQFGYENPFENKNYGRFYLSAQIDGDTAAGEESIFSVTYKPDVDPDSRTPEPMDGIDGKAKEKIQYQEFQNVVEYMKSNIDYEFARNFYAENAENRMNESVPAKERFDDLQFDSETDFYVGRYTNVFYSADDIQEIQENWIKADNMFPQTQKIFIDGQEFTFTTEGSYANIGSIYEKYREDTYVEVRAAAETCSKPVVNRDIYEDGVIFANSVIVCVYGHLDGDADISDSKYVKYKGEDGEWHYYADRWTDVIVPEESIGQSDSPLSEQLIPDPTPFPESIWGDNSGDTGSTASVVELAPTLEVAAETVEFEIMEEFNNEAEEVYEMIFDQLKEEKSDHLATALKNAYALYMMTIYDNASCEDIDSYSSTQKYLHLGLSNNASMIRTYEQEARFAYYDFNYIDRVWKNPEKRITRFVDAMTEFQLAGGATTDTEKQAVELCRTYVTTFIAGRGNLEKVMEYFFEYVKENPADEFLSRSYEMYGDRWNEQVTAYFEILNSLLQMQF